MTSRIDDVLSPAMREVRSNRRFSNGLFYGNLEDIPLANPTLARWFNTDAGFEKDPAKAPAAFQKRTFPFRVDGVRGQNLTATNLSIQRPVVLGRRLTWRSTRCASSRA